MDVTMPCFILGNWILPSWGNYENGTEYTHKFSYWKTGIFTYNPGKLCRVRKKLSGKSTQTLGAGTIPEYTKMEGPEKYGWPLRGSATVPPEGHEASLGQIFSIIQVKTTYDFTTKSVRI